MQEAVANLPPYRVPLPSPSVFDSLDADAKASLEAELVWLSLPGGRVLFYQDDAATGLYMVLTGCLGLVVEAVSHDEPAVLVQAGEIVGEYSLLLNRPQASTCVAIRDTSLVWLSRQSFDELVRKHPEALLPFTAQLIELFGRALSFRRRIFTVPKTLALIPLHEGAPVAELAAMLVAAVGDAGQKATAVDSEAVKLRADVFQAFETEHDLVIYCGDTVDSEWTRTCIRQADRVQLVANTKESPYCHEDLLEAIKTLPWRQAELVLIQEDATRSPAPAESWLRQYPSTFHCHIRMRSRADIARLARYVTGRALAVVLSGGGARGFAHIGVLKALREAHIQIDLVGGTSMGAIIAAGAALEWDDREMYQRMYDGFVKSNPLGDYVIPFVALTRGRKVERRLRRHFADARVEDMWRPYFAVASNLTTGEAAVLRQGVLWRALRASIAIPGVLPPVIENREVLADGGVMNNLPCDVMDAMRRGPVIGVDVARDQSLAASETRSLFNRLFVPSDYYGPGIVSLLLRAATVGGTIQTRSSRDHADLVLAPPMQNIRIRDWKSFDHAIEEGYRDTMERIGEIAEIVANVGRKN
jgi:NTE family protein